MPFNYAALVAPFKSIIGEFEMGTVSIVRRVAAQDPDDPWRYTTTDTETGLNAVVTGVSSKRVNGTSILYGDLYVIISSADVSFPPQDSDLVVIDGKRHQVHEVIPSPPAGQPIIYRMRVRAV